MGILSNLKVISKYMELASRGVSQKTWDSWDSNKQREYLKKNPMSRYQPKELNYNTDDIYKLDTDDIKKLLEDSVDKARKEIKPDGIDKTKELLEKKEPELDESIPSVEELNKELKNVRNRIKRLRYNHLDKQFPIIADSSLFDDGFSFTYKLKKDDEEIEGSIYNIGNNESIHNINGKHILGNPGERYAYSFLKLFELDSDVEITGVKKIPLLKDLIPKEYDGKPLQSFIITALYGIKDEDDYILKHNLDNYVFKKYLGDAQTSINKDKQLELDKEVIKEYDDYIKYFPKAMADFKNQVDERIKKLKSIVPNIDKKEKDFANATSKKRNVLKYGWRGYYVPNVDFDTKEEALRQIKKAFISINNRINNPKDDEVIYDLDKIKAIARHNDITKKEIENYIFTERNLDAERNAIQEKAEKEVNEREALLKEMFVTKKTVEDSFKKKIIDKQYSIKPKDIEQMLSKSMSLNTPSYEFKGINHSLQDMDYKRAYHEVTDGIDYSLKFNSMPEKISVFEHNAKLLQELLGVKNKSNLKLKLDTKKGFNEVIPVLESSESILNTLIDKDLLPKDYKEVTIKTRKGKRANFMNNGGSKGKLDTINLDENDNPFVVTHEVMHLLEYNNHRIGEASRQFLEYRTKNEKIKSLNSLTKSRGYGSNERAKADNFFNPYCGKVYRQELKFKDWGATEIMSMGLQEMLEHPREFYKRDPEYFNFVLMNLKGEF